MKNSIRPPGHPRPRRYHWIAAAVVLCAAGCGRESSNAIRWGADQEGGGPYVYPRDDDPTKLIGFEVDLAASLGKRLGKPTEFVQCTWENILPLVSRGNIDLALNGYEFMPDRAERYRTSIPYYIYELGLCVRKNDHETRNWDDLKKPRADGSRKRIGVLGASAADRYVAENFGKNCDVVHYEGLVEALEFIGTGKIDAAVQDLPILHFYLETKQRFPNLEVIDRPVAPGYYVIYARPDDKSLIDDANYAIRRMYESGELRKIYEQYGIWNDTQTQLPGIWDTWKAVEPSAESLISKWDKLAQQWTLLRRAAGVTVLLAVLSMPLAMLIGLSVALIRGWSTPALGGSGEAESLALRWLQRLATLYVEIVRGTPLAFQLWVVYFVVPELLKSLSPAGGLAINEFWSGVIALAVNYSAYEAEIFRLGLQAIPRGQMEAALSLGMPRALAVRRIILPQAVRIVIPATANDFIALFKDTAVCSVIAVEELSKQYSMGAKNTGLFLEMALLTSLLYLAMSYPLSLLAQWLERRLKTPA